MKRILNSIIFVLTVWIIILPQVSYALPNVENEIGPIPCQGVCPPKLQSEIYNRPKAVAPQVAIPAEDYAGQDCTGDYEIFLTDPVKWHYWAEDVEVTNQGKADERARQFIYWVVNSEKIEHQVLGQVWNTTRNVAYFLVLLVAVAIGIGFIISQRTNYNLKIKVWPAIWKILLALLYITFSFALLSFMIDMSEVLMKFFIDQLGGKDLFNIYFTPNQSSEFNYTGFYGCRDMNIRSQEAAEAELTMLRMTNVTYYVMGTMLLLRKILLWFLLFVSPFLAILMPFVFVRNTGWIWIGVFFQWLFYGPLFALFLGALSRIWKMGIPLKFDFSRTNKPEGYIYPTSIRILYGGPAQRLDVLNNANYIDTYVEYIITLIMLWAVTFFPWWLLRIFRDYCCDVFAAANNVLVQMYDQMRAPPGGNPPFGPTPPTKPTSGLSQTLPKQELKPRSEAPTAIRIESLREIRSAKTSDIMTSLHLSAPRLTDIARFETNKEKSASVQKTLQYLSNPVKAQTPAERQTFMNLRTELFSRSVKQDRQAKEILASTSTSFTEKREKQKEILNTTSQAVPMSQIVSQTTNIAQEKVQSITNNIANAVANNTQAITNIAQSANLSQSQVQSVLNSYAQSQSSNQPMSQTISNIAEANNITKEQVSEVLQKSMSVAQASSVISQTATKESISQERVKEILSAIPLAVEQSRVSEQPIVQNISQQTNMPVQKTQTITNSLINTVTNNSTAVSQIAQSTNLSQEQVKSVLTSYSQNTNQNIGQAVSSIAQSSNVSREKVSDVLREASTQMQQSSTIRDVAEREKVKSEEVQKISESLSKISEREKSTQAPAALSQAVSEQSKSIVSSLFNSISSNQSTMQQIQKETGLSNNQVQNIFSTYVSNIGQPAEVVAQRIHESAGIETNKVAPVMKQILKNASDTSYVPHAVIAEVAKKEKISEEEVQKVIDAQVPAVTAPDKQIERSIPIPSTVSIEDYEEVKKMWTQQYEKGEVPVSGQVADRSQWVDQDIVTITNTLNKLMSSDEKLRMEGLDDIGYILPVFMINNMKGDEMMVYLKAKLEAAKSTQAQMQHDVEVKLSSEVQQQPEEEFVDIKVSRTQAAPRVLHLELEEDVPTSSRFDISAEDSVSDSFATVASSVRRAPAFTINTSEIQGITTSELLGKLDMIAQKLTDIARLETNQQSRETVQRHIEFISNPSRASTDEERKTYADVRTELTTRAGASDQTAQHLVTPEKETILKSVPMAISSSQAVSNIVKLTQEKTQSVTSSVIQSVLTNSSAIESITKTTELPRETVQTIFQSFVSTMNLPTTQVVNTISSQTNIAHEKVMEVMQEVNSIMQQSRVVESVATTTKSDLQYVETILQSAPELVSQSTPVSQKDAGIISSIITTSVSNNSVVQNIQNETNLSQSQVRSMLTTYAQNSAEAPTVIVERVAQVVGMEKERVAPAIKSAMQIIKSDSLAARGIVKDIATKEGITEEQVAKVVDTQVPMMASPEKNIEKSVPIPSSVSLEDYEEVKQMWTQQYEKGEIPTTENIANREQWIDQDTVFITNTLNKLMSTDEKLRMDGLDDLGYILPVFMVNNMKGDEMMVYLKAKLEAAKAVRVKIDLEKDIKLKMEAEQPEVEYVDLKPQQTETPQVLHMEVDQESARPQDDESSLSDSFATVASSVRRAPAFTINTSEIQGITTSELLGKLDMIAQKLTDIARLETNQQSRETVQRHIEFISNPSRASTDEERKTYADVRTELTTRAGASDQTAQHLVTPEKETILKSVPQAAPAMQAASSVLKFSPQKTQAATSSVIQTITENNDVMESIVKTTETPRETVQTIFQSFVSTMNLPTTQVVNTISSQTNIAKEKVIQVLEQISTIARESQTVESVASVLQTDTQTVETILQSAPQIVTQSTTEGAAPISNQQAAVMTSIIANTVTNNSAMQSETKNILTTYAQNISQPASTIVERVARSAGIEAAAVRPALQSAMQAVTSDALIARDVVKAVAKKEHVAEEQVAQLIEEQIPAVLNPEKHIEKSVMVPSNVSIEDYEEVKKMWMHQYEEGEIPSTENIANREQWIDQDTVFITNTLNKLMSTDEKLRMDGLDDLGYILPVFMVNNMKGDEMMVYLKAKLEAAKAVQAQLEREKEITLKIESSQPETEYVNISTPSVPAEMHMQVEEPTAEVSQIKATIASMKGAHNVRPISFLPSELKTITTSELLGKLDMIAQKLTDIARLETNQQSRETVQRHIEFISNPSRASTDEERKTYADVRTELTTRAGASDQTAQHLVTPEKETILKSVPMAISSSQAVSNIVKLTQEKTQSVTSSVIQSVLTNSSAIESITKTTELPRETVQTIFQSFVSTMNLPTTQVVNTISSQTNIAHEKVMQTIQSGMQYVKSDALNERSIIKEIAAKESISEEQVTRVVDAQVPALTNVEQTVPIPETVSLEDYEEVKRMWKDQYENGEIPTDFGASSREEWIDKEIQLITNTLNKLLSDNDQLRRDGLDDIGYILPIFMANNMKGDEMLVYLKAKLEAAKIVQGELEKEDELKRRLQKEMNPEELVEVEKPDKEKDPNKMELEQEVEKPGEEEDLKTQQTDDQLDAAVAEATNSTIPQKEDEIGEEIK